MQMLEQQLAERYPHWFRGRRAMVARPLLRGLGRWSRLSHAYEFLASHAHLSGFPLVEAAMEFLNLGYTVNQVERHRIPSSGRLLIVANHPSGALDALALLHLVGNVRSDVKFVANDLLAQVEGLRELLLPVRILGGKASAESIEAIEQALREEKCVILFPAGEVSRLGPRGVTDRRWRRHFLRFAKAGNAPVLPVWIEARNSALFYGASAVYKPAGTALLAREMFKRNGSRVALRVGPLLEINHAIGPEANLAKVRRVLYSIGRRDEAQEQPQALIPAVNRTVLHGVVQSLQLLGETSDGKRAGAGRSAGYPGGTGAGLVQSRLHARPRGQ